MRKILFLLFLAGSIYGVQAQTCCTDNTNVKTRSSSSYICNCMSGPSYLNPGQSAVYYGLSNQITLRAWMEGGGSCSVNGNNVTVNAPSWYSGYIYLHVEIKDLTLNITGEHINKIMVGNGIDDDAGRNYNIVGPRTLKQGQTASYTFSDFTGISISSISITSANMEVVGLDYDTYSALLKASDTFTGNANVRVNFSVYKDDRYIRTYKDFTVYIEPK